MKKLFAAALLVLSLAACNTEKESSDHGRYTYAGSLTVTNAQNAVTYQAQDVRFDLTEQNGVLTLVMNEVMFDPRMPQPFTIMITNLDSTTDPNGNCTLVSTVTPIVPLIGGTPYESFQIPTFTGEISGKNMAITFRCISAQFHLDHTAVYQGIRTN